MTLFLDLLGFGVILPVQPFYAESFGASATQVTLIGASYSLMQFVFAPLWGRLSDRIGRRPVILVSVAFACLGWLILGFADALWMFVLSRVVAGFGNANLGTVQAVVADVTVARERAKGMGLVGTAFGFGFLFGPLVGGYFGGRFGPEVPAFIAAALSVLNWCAAFFLLPESHPKERRAAASRLAPPEGVEGHAGRRSILPLKDLREAMTMSSVAPLLAMGFVFTVGFSLMEAALSLFVERQFVSPALLDTDARHKEAATLATQVLVTIGITAVTVQGWLIRPLRNRYGEPILLLVGSVLIAVGFGATATLPFVLAPFGAMLAIQVIVASGSGVFSPSSSSLLSRSVPSDRQGAILGVGQSVSALGRIVGPSLAGALLDLHRSLPFALGAVLLGAAAVLSLRVKEPAPDAAIADV
jgi:DHA1 family tetracycline resistance protein-like MFS transporter